MQSLILALALINAPVEEQYEMLADLYDADPRLAYEVLDVADELGADTEELAIVFPVAGDFTDDTDDEDWAVIRNISPKDDSTKNPDVSKWNYPKDDTVNVKDAYDVKHGYGF